MCLPFTTAGDPSQRVSHFNCKFMMKQRKLCALIIHETVIQLSMKATHNAVCWPTFRVGRTRNNRYESVNPPRELFLATVIYDDDVDGFPIYGNTSWPASNIKWETLGHYSKLDFQLPARPFPPTLCHPPQQHVLSLAYHHRWRANNMISTGGEDKEP